MRRKKPAYHRRPTNRLTPLLMELWKNGKNDCQIAEIINCTPSAIWQWWRKNALPRNCESGWQH